MQDYNYSSYFGIHDTRQGLRCSQNSDFIQHYGVHGQRWGVTTKEYQPVAVDRRKTRFQGPLARTKSKYRAQVQRDNEYVSNVREQRQEWLQKMDNRRSILAKSLGVGALALSLYGGYKLSGIKINGKGALKSLMNFIPNKSERRASVNKGFMALMAKSQSSSSGLDKVKQTLVRSGQIFTGQRYKQHLQTAKNLISQFGHNSIDTIDKIRRKG